MTTGSYVLITPARNEGDYVEKTINSVIHQTVLPLKWVIVSDGSTDRTDEIVSNYSERYSFIQLVRGEFSSYRNFVSKVWAIRTGLEQIKGLKYEFIGNLDADVSFEPSYYEGILAKFLDNPKLGVAGGVIFDYSRGKWIRQFTSDLRSVGGAIQMFRRKCYEDVGGYVALPVGGIDTVAEVMARRCGWEVKSYADLIVRHHRLTGTVKEHILLARFRSGIREYSIGYLPLFHIAKGVYRIRERPYLLGSLFRFMGFFYAFMKKQPRAVPHEVVNYLRREQHERLHSFVLRKRRY